MAKYEYDVGIIGGGAAGLTVASGAAQLGLKTLLVEREPRLGGDCLHYGCVPSKTLIKCASVYNDISNSHRFGLPEGGIGKVDFSKISSRIKDVIDTIQKHDSDERFRGLGVTVEYGIAQFWDSHVIQLGKHKISAKYWVIATGAEATIPNISGLTRGPFLTNRDIFSLKEIPQSLVVLGGGPIGCEIGQAFARLGTQVTILQRNKQLLPMDDMDAVEVVKRRLEREGVNIALGVDVDGISYQSDRVDIQFSLLGEKTNVCADKVLVAVGRTPNVKSLKLENAGVDYSLKGVKTDSRLRTSCKHIFAAGDVLGKYNFTHAAGYEGGIVLSNLVFKIPRKVDYRWLPWCTYTSPELAGIGMTEKTARNAGIEYSVWMEPFSQNDRAQSEFSKEGFIKLILDKREKPLGVQIVGARAGDLIGEWAAILNSNLGLSKVASVIHPYPTLVEINKRIAGNVISSKLFSSKVRKALKFIFGYKGGGCSLD